MNLAVIIATFGRREIVAHLLDELAAQDRLPDKVVVAAPDFSHLPQVLATLPFPVDLIIGRRGSAAQRNDALDHIHGEFDVITFLDDDFVPARDYLALIEEAFIKRPEWAVVMGHVIEDAHIKHHVGAYGCNMSVRENLIGDLRFDERLVIYGWQ